MLSILPSLLALGLAALTAYLLAIRRTSSPQLHNKRQLAARVLALTAGAQSVHFIEESLTGFHSQFPEVFGLPEIPLSVFVAFNVLMLAIWFSAIPGLRAGKKFAYFVSWFLAIAGILNLLAHPVLSLVVGGYFPGLITSPLIGGMGIWLWICLFHATSRRQSATT